MSLTATMIGTEEFGKALTEITDRLAVNAVKKGSDEGAKIVADAIREECPVDSGMLRFSVTTKKIAQKKKGFAGSQAMVGEGFFKGETWYSGAIQFGHKTRPDKDGWQTVVPPNPFVTRAVEKSHVQAFAAMAAAIREELQAAVERTRKKRMRDEARGIYT